MGPEGKKEVVLYFDDTRIGTLSEFDESPTIEPSEPLELGNPLAMSGSMTLRLTAEQWTSCRTRKRFIKLMAGVFGVQRNQATALAKVAMEAGCPSYMDLWADCFAYFIRQTLQYMADHDRPSDAEPHSGASDTPTERNEQQ